MNDNSSEWSITLFVILLLIMICFTLNDLEKEKAKVQKLREQVSEIQKIVLK